MAASVDEGGTAVYPLQNVSQNHLILYGRRSDRQCLQQCLRGFGEISGLLLVKLGKFSGVLSNRSIIL
ncbi:MAG: hypothetical protein M5U34_04535 [Chloroflexi bacterium]|nr:hypothetical protein [Chloroflexota bacterium]